MGDQQVGARFDRLIDRGGDGIDGEAHALALAASGSPLTRPEASQDSAPANGHSRSIVGEDLCEGGRHPTSLSRGGERTRR